MSKAKSAARKSKQKPTPKSKGSKKMPKKSKGGTSPVVSLLRPRKTEAILKIGKDFVDEKMPQLNAGLYTKAEYEVMLKAVKASKEDGKMPPPLPYLYSPVIVQIARKLKCDFAVRGQTEKQLKAPPEWNTGKLGTHEPGMKIDRFRMNHADDVRKMIEKPEENLRTIGSREYVLGTADTPAVLLVNSARSGNYYYNIRVAKRLSLSGIKDLKDLVGQIGNKLRVEKFEDGIENVWLPNQELSWGYLEKDGKRLTTSAIRKLPDDTTGIRFVALKKTIVGNAVDKDTCLKEIKREMSLAATKDESGRTVWERFSDRKKKKGTDTESCGWTNLTAHQTRINPNATNCLGFRNVQLEIPPFTEKDVDGNILIRFAVGCRLVTKLVPEKKVKKTIAKVVAPKVTKTATKTKTKAETPEIVSTEPVEAATESVVSAEFSDDYSTDQALIDVDDDCVEPGDEELSRIDEAS